MKLYLNVDQAKLIRSGLYAQQRELKAAIDKGVTGPVLEIAEEGLQEIERMTLFLNHEIEKETA